jgi:hypothetical protein
MSCAPPQVWEDVAVKSSQIDLTQLHEGLTQKHLAKLERDFLQALDYNVGVRATVYTDWYFKLCSLADKSELRVRPLNPEEAKLLEIRGALFESHIRASNQRTRSGPIDGRDMRAGESPRSRLVID